ncbi:MAG: hypothetical protein OZ917_04240 [Candidatus Brocadiaceae bacterium]|nr:hypothetical protein [Candidatus Brocadiaceae bacterium]
MIYHRIVNAGCQFVEAVHMVIAGLIDGVGRHVAEYNVRVESDLYL